METPQNQQATAKTGNRAAPANSRLLANESESSYKRESFGGRRSSSSRALALFRPTVNPREIAAGKTAADRNTHQASGQSGDEPESRAPSAICGNERLCSRKTRIGKLACTTTKFAG